MVSSFAMQYAGTDFMPTRYTEADILQVFEAVGRSGPLLLKGRPAPRPKQPVGPRPVFTSPTGDQFTPLPTVAGAVMVPWIAGSTLDPASPNVTGGGFFPKNNLAAQWGARPATPPPGPSRDQIIAAAMAALLEMQQEARTPGSKLAPPGPKDGNSPPPAQDGGGGADHSTGSGGSGPLVPPLPPPPPPKGVSETVMDALPGLAQQQLVGFLSNAFETGTLFKPFGDALQGIAGGMLSTAAYTIAMKFLGGKAPDDSSSMFEWAKATVAPALVGKIMGMGNLNKYFGMGLGPPSPFALRVGDLDPMKFAVLQGFPSVLIEGKVAARDTDPVDKAGVAIQYGAKTVRTGNQFAARTFDSLSKNGPFDEKTACMATRTQIGGVSTNPHPPVPQALMDLWKQRKGEDAPPLSEKGRWNPNDPNPPNTPGLYLTDGEWRIWDGNAWSMTLSELSNVWDTANLWGSTSDMTKDWTFFLPPDFFNLGSAAFPGAGNKDVWFAPDVLFGIDMSSLYHLHDWIHDPSNPAHGNFLDGGFFHYLMDQYEPLTNVGNNPFQWLFHGVYELAITTGTLGEWMDNWLTNIDEDLGMTTPDTPFRYRYYPPSNRRSPV